MPGATKPASATPASTAETGPIIHRFEYDAVGNRTRHIDAENHATRWEHDKAGRVTARILPGGQRETMEYNLVGELVAKTDFIGRTTRYTYDRAGRVDSIDYPGDGDVTLTYTRMGLRETVTDGAFRRLAQKVDLELLVRFARADCSGRAGEFDCLGIEWFFDRARSLGVEHKPPAPILLGRHLIDLGVNPGPEMGRILKAIYELQLDGAVTDLDDARREAAQLLQGSGRV